MPAMQSLHAVKPVSLAKRPVEHAVHSTSVGLTWNKPAAHGVHDVWAVLLTLPWPHSEHTDAPASDWVLPVHAMQSVAA